MITANLKIQPNLTMLIFELLKTFCSEKMEKTIHFTGPYQESDLKFIIDPTMALGNSYYALPSLFWC
jgi:hypothetical protein